MERENNPFSGGSHTILTGSANGRVKRKAPWIWENKLVCTNLTELDMFYAVLGHSKQLWSPDPTTNQTMTTVPCMLAFPPDCVSYCATEERTPHDLATYIQGILGASQLDESKYSLMLDWCCMAAHRPTRQRVMRLNPATSPSP
jgi:hypothetical protein